MNIKFLTFILCAGLLCAQAARAEDEASVDDFGLDETAAALEDTAAETAEETKPQLQNTVQELAAEKPVVITETIETVEVTPDVSAQEKAEPSVAEAENKSENSDLSMYVKALNLDAKQLVQAREISNSGRLHREQLKHSIERLQEQVKELENKNLEEFAKILTPEQLEVLQKLRQNYEANNAENK